MTTLLTQLQCKNSSHLSLEDAVFQTKNIFQVVGVQRPSKGQSHAREKKMEDEEKK